mmetsp:Transcript_25607/g.70473  ORF Transcript_25607/g.70473 Transcript_25607/m.70473 type:complete len:213 (-) Transcript_25607:1916-2554(-)
MGDDTSSLDCIGDKRRQRNGLCHYLVAALECRLYPFDGALTDGQYGSIRIVPRLSLQRFDGVIQNRFGVVADSEFFRVVARHQCHAFDASNADIDGVLSKLLVAFFFGRRVILDMALVALHDLAKHSAWRYRHEQLFRAVNAHAHANVHRRRSDRLGRIVSGLDPMVRRQGHQNDAHVVRHDTGSLHFLLDEIVHEGSDGVCRGSREWHAVK